MEKCSGELGLKIVKFDFKVTIWYDHATKCTGLKWLLVVDISAAIFAPYCNLLAFIDRSFWHTFKIYTFDYTKEKHSKVH